MIPYLLIAAAAIALCLLVTMDHHRRRERDEQERLELNRQLQESIERALEQDSRGERLFQAMKAASDGRPNQDWRVSIGRIKNNAGAYSVIAQERDSAGNAMGCGMQFDIHPDRLSYFLNFNESGKMEPTEFEQFLKLATDRVSSVD